VDNEKVEPGAEEGILATKAMSIISPYQSGVAPADKEFFVEHE